MAGAYLAAAGKRVLVLERNGWFGGGVVTRELTLPGFRHDQHSMAHIFIHANPLLAADELKLKEKYGLRYVFPDPPMMSMFEDGSTLNVGAVIWSTGYQPDHSWIELPVIADDGTARHRRGVTDVPGLYFLGLPWQYTRGSALLGWVKDDAQFIAEQIAANDEPTVVTATGGRAAPTSERI